MISAESGSKPIILETVVLRLDKEVECVYPYCISGSVIKIGEDALQSPSNPGFFYHIDCFKALIRETGRNPDTCLKIIDTGRIKEN